MKSDKLRLLTDGKPHDSMLFLTKSSQKPVSDSDWKMSICDEKVKLVLFYLKSFICYI